MATIVLSAIGAGLGASIGGSVLGLSSVVIGRAVGAIAGRMIDNRLMSTGSEPVETGKVDRLRITGVSEGAPVGQVYGRYRLGGQVIWSGKVRENRTITDGDAQGSGKGFLAPKGPTVTEYSYSVSLAIALCEGEITHVGRIWADGKEVKPKHLTMRVYPGDEAQMPDPALEAALGAGKVPAFRGTAYVVIENLDITQYGNRIPVFNFEVFRPEQPGETPDLARGTKAVAMIPGCGEYALATDVVHFGGAPGKRKPANKHTPLGKPDFEASLGMLEGELPNCESVSLVVSWFGTDLRADQCEIAPRVDQKDRDGVKMPWQVSGLDRDGASLVPYEADRAVYGGTPTDFSVYQAIVRLKEAGKAVTFYPFILMEQMDGNGRTDPWTGVGSQPKLPWRGRITTSKAPGQAGSPDGTAAAEAEVAAFFGNAQPHHFIPVEGTVNYIGPYEWSYRRMILHYATICAQAGGVEAFLIGSELRGLTQIRGAGNSFPVVEQLQALANDVRLILGPGVKISYAADWSEYFGYHPQDGSGDVYFHLDALWADPNIDFIGIDNYMPVSDWREGEDHADAHWGSIYNLNYLKSNVMGGEGYDWYYHAPEAREVQLRTPITDGAHGEPWVWRYKDIRGWWENEHHNRNGGVRQSASTDWVAGSKPIWFTEYGCAAIDKGTNEPNKFLDPKSSESSLPRYSNGHRDDFMQMQYLRAVREFWEDPANNPVHQLTGVKMIDMDRAHVWAWDARPFPWFPKKRAAWGDWENYERGHWLNGRASNRSLASVVSEICARSGVTHFDVSRLYGLVRGYMVDQVTDARTALQPLMLAYGFEAAEREGVLEFFTRKGTPDGTLDPARFVATDEIEGDLEFSRAPEAEMVGRVRLNHTESESAYEVRSVEAIFPDEETHSVSSSDLPMILTQAEARGITERWLAEARVARDRARFALAPSDLSWRAGDVVELETADGTGYFRIDHVEQAGVQMIQAVRVEPGVLTPSDGVESEIELAEFTPAVPVYPVFLDLPLLTGDETPHLPRLAVASDPWPGPVAVYSSASENGYSLNQVIRAPARIGVTESTLRWARPGLIDRGPALRVRLPQGAVSSAGLDGILSGSNVAAIGFGDPDGWEVFQFSDALLVEEDVYELSGRLRGQAGSDWAMPAEWPVGSTVVFLDSAVTPLNLPLSARGLERHYRIGPASEIIDDETYEHNVVTTYGVGLRPYTPAHVSARASGGDYAVTWVRRTRIDGDSWQGVEVPLGEESESYVLRVIDGGSVKREVVVTSAAWTYSAAMQAADGVTAPFEIEVAQVSQSFGPGPGARIVVGG
ncbi:glycoside hydrolase/phage tail family protein [uncultured Maritimibacter sp.]|uniref:baseplate multidomain protein megatron n=1 Tax=uncultured Maritimibacter sp. TaxID=991866 RepID=UPI002596A0F4|nr:glycoside hydrolase/phage tail family protein [uncultured Maritimibacter sp.]